MRGELRGDLSAGGGVTGATTNGICVHSESCEGARIASVGMTRNDVHRVSCAPRPGGINAYFKQTMSSIVLLHAPQEHPSETSLVLPFSSPVVSAANATDSSSSIALEVEILDALRAWLVGTSRPLPTIAKTIDLNTSRAVVNSRWESEAS